MLELLAAIGIALSSGGMLAAPDAFVAPPRVIMVWGGTLKDTVYLTDRDANAAVALAINSGEIAPSDGSGRECFMAAFFWLPSWRRIDLSSLRALRPEDTRVRGRFCSMLPGSAPIFVYDKHPPDGRSARARKLDYVVVATLKMHGIPIEGAGDH